MAKEVDTSLTHVGRGYVVTNGKLYQTSNLATLRKKVGKQLVQQVSIARTGNGEGLMSVFFTNGDQTGNRWASFEVLKNSLRNWRNLYGAPLEVEGADRGKISYTNDALL